MKWVFTQAESNLFGKIAVISFFLQAFSNLTFRKNEKPNKKLILIEILVREKIDIFYDAEGFCISLFFKCLFLKSKIKTTTCNHWFKVNHPIIVFRRLSARHFVRATFSQSTMHLFYLKCKVLRHVHLKNDSQIKI